MTLTSTILKWLWPMAAALVLVTAGCERQSEVPHWAGWKHYRTRPDTYSFEAVQAAYLAGCLGLPQPGIARPLERPHAYGVLSWNELYGILVLSVKLRFGFGSPQIATLADSSGTILWSRRTDMLMEPRVSDTGICAIVSFDPFPVDSVPAYVVAHIDSVVEAEAEGFRELSRQMGLARAAAVLDSIALEFLDRDGQTVGGRKWPRDVFPPSVRDYWAPFQSMGFGPRSDICIVLSRQLLSDDSPETVLHVDALTPTGEMLWSYGPTDLPLNQLLLDTGTDVVVAYGGRQCAKDAEGGTFTHNAVVALRHATGEVVASFQETAPKGFLGPAKVDSAGYVTFWTDSLWCMDLTTGEVRAVKRP